MQEEDILQHTNVSFMHILVNLLRPLCNLGHTSQNVIEHTHANILASVLEHRVSWGDKTSEVIDHECNLVYI